MHHYGTFPRFAIKSPGGFSERLRTTSLTFFFCLMIGSLIVGSSVMAATITTDSLEYNIESIVGIRGSSFAAGETVHMTVTYADGTPLPVTIPNTWDVVADGFGDVSTGGSSTSDGDIEQPGLEGFLTNWLMANEVNPGDTLLLTATGGTSGVEASTELLCKKYAAHHLQNTTGGWAYGNINSTNSCYSEGSNVPYRFFAYNLAASSTHTFQITYQATKNEFHCFDYISEYDMTESGPITTFGGECGNTSKPAPTDCYTPTVVATLPDPTLSTSYASTLPPELSDILSPLFAVDGPGDLYAYNATNVALSQISIGGTASGRLLSVTITFDVIVDGSVGFYWGGHLAEGQPNTWGVGQGAAAVGGSPHHTSAGLLDGRGGMSNLSIQGLEVCEPPDVTLTCDPGPYCVGSTHTCSVPSGADTYFWTVTGATIISGQNTSSITYTITVAAGDPITISINACNVTSGCGGSGCCSDATTQFIADDCCDITITCPVDLTVDCDQSTDPANTGTATYTVNGSCPTPITVSYTDTETAGTCAQEKTITRLWKAFDGNSQLRDQCTQTITVVDNTAPVLTGCPANVTVECNAVPAVASVTATDNCDPAPTLNFTETSVAGTCPQEYTLTRTWTATDACGNSSSCSQTVTVNDTQAPQITCPAPVTVQCLADVPAVDLNLVTATDNCDSNPVISLLTETNDGQTCPKTITRTYKAVDACGNMATCTQIITVDDTMPPVVTCPADLTVECASDVPAPNVAQVTATDNCDPNPVVVFASDVSDGQSCPETITRTYQATDACSNIATCTQIITVDDITPPVVTCPADVAVECASDVPASNVALVTVTDNCDPNPVVVFVGDVSDGQSCPETITRTYKATDFCGNESICTQLITVDDITPPVVTCPAPVAVSCMADVPTVNTGLVTATDNCDPAPVITFVSDVPSGTSCPMTITRTYKATDFCDNESTCTQLITVDDQTPPQITCPTDITVECIADVPSPNSAMVTAWDNCGGTPTVTWVSDTPAGSCPTTVTRVYKATDDCGNEAFCQQIITVDDQTPPTMTCPTTVTVECLADVPVPNTSLVTATDNCDPNPVVSFLSDSDDGQTCPKTITRTYKAVDACGNIATCTQTILVDDNTPPVVTCPVDVTVECSSDVPAPNVGLVTATDNCDPAPVVTFVSDVSDGQTCPETITRTYQATDFCGNIAIGTQIITVDDTTPPVVTCPADISVQCNDPTDPSFTGTATATDNCSAVGNITIAYSDNINGGTIRTWTATDECGNQSSCVQTITVLGDNEPPQFTCPPDFSVECLDDVPPADPGAITATDNCDANPVVTLVSEVPSGTICPLTITRTFRASDASGNYAECSQIITVYDQTPPQLVNCPVDIVISCDASVPAPASVSATDNCTGVTLDFVENETVGSCSQEKTITRTWTATDACGNSISCAQTITIEDNVAPTVTCPGPVVVECAADVPAPNTSLVTVTDNCDPAPVVTFVNDVSDGQTCPETITRTYKAIDACGNSGFCTQIITIDDTIPPVITCPADVLVNCQADVPLSNIGLVTVTDNCDPNPVITFVSDVPSGTSCPMTITRTYKATDFCGNESTCTQLITVDDQIPPVITCPTDLTVECMGDVPAYDIGMVTATDNCGGTPVVEWVSDSPVGTCPTVITRVYKATDDCGNEAFCQQIITVDDQTSPTMTCPATITVECLTDVPAPNPSLVTATDNCDPNPVVSFLSDSDDGQTCPKTITRTYKAIDACGNIATCTQIIIVDDTTPPVVTCPVDVTVECSSDVPAPNVAQVTATDNCDPAPVVTFVSDVSDGQTCPETITRTYQATDFCSNSAICTQTITVDDTTPPTVTCPADVLVNCQADVPLSNIGLVTVTDNCDPNPVITFVSDVPSGTSCPMTITRTYKATDFCGNESTCTQLITVDDQIPPQITCPTDLTVECMGDVPAYDIGMVTATDNCGATPVIEWVSDTPVGTCPTVITRVYKATDDCGNEAFCQQIITVDDQTSPVLSGCPADVTVDCGGVPASANVTATDNCSGVTVSFNEVTTPGSCDYDYVVTRTWTATDDCGNSASCTQTITVQDNIAPTITCPADLTVGCLTEVPVADPSLVTVSDNCDPAPQVFALADQQSGTDPIIITRTYRAFDACDNSVDCIQIITVDDQEPPVFIGCPTDVTVECGHIPDVPVVTATDNCDGDVPVDFAEGVIPGPCAFTYTLVRTWTATDSFGNTSTCQQNINIEDVIAPEITCPTDVTVECIFDVPVPDVSLVIAIDNCDPNPLVEWVDDNLIGTSCPMTLQRTYQVTDACGNWDTCNQMFLLDDQTPPVFTVFPEDQAITMCEPTEICLDLDAEDNCSGRVLLSVVDGPGAESGYRWCYTPTGSGSFDVTIRAEDTCGNFVDDVFHVDIALNTPPTITNCPEDTTIHWGETFLHDFTASDPDIGQTLTYSLCETTPEGVTIDAAGHLNWVSSAQDICDPAICVIVTDSCGAADTCEFDICVTNDPPVITCPENMTICHGYPFETQVTATDPDNGPYAIFRLISGPVGLTLDATTGEIVWDEPEPGAWEICVEASDEAPVCDPCSPASADTSCFTLNVVALDLVIEKIHNQFQNQHAEVSIDFMHQGSNWPIAGYDLLIQYDPTALSFLKATEGQFFTDCAWEYFTYRFGASGNCGVGACPTGILRIVAMAETTGGNLANHPDCYTNDGIADPGPGSSTATELAVMHFMVTDDRTVECTFAPIRFIWYDCGDNALSNIVGDTLHISNEVYDYGGEIGDPPVVQWNLITGLDNTFPTVTGALSPDCDISFKSELIRCANFYNGGVDIVCADSIDAAGDININGIAYEIADAVMFTNYFINGLPAFDPHVEGSIAASDANRDGLSLSVADLVYIIRVVIGDALPYAKVSPVTERVSYTFDNGVVAITDDIDISGAALIVRGNVEPQLLVDDMSMRYAFDGNNTRIVVTPSMEATTMASFRGEFLGGVNGELVSLELSTSEGAMALAKNVPIRFSLTQNYPNPFNPVTIIEFALPEPIEYSLTIFNIQGQVVATHEGRADAPGVFRFEWDATEHASGVYLYRLEAGAGTFVQTRKMLLLK